MSFGVDTDTMASAATKIELAAEQIDGVLAKIRSDIATMLEGWAGEGADAHVDLHTRFDADVVTINTNLRQMHQALLRTHSLYVTQETEQSSDHASMQNTIAR